MYQILQKPSSFFRRNNNKWSHVYSDAYTVPKTKVKYVHNNLLNNVVLVNNVFLLWYF